MSVSTNPKPVEDVKEEMGAKQGYNKQKDALNKKFKRKYEQNTRGFRGTKPNDISWYAKSEQMLRDAGSLAYSQPQGIPVTRAGLSLASYPIHVLSILPTIGKASSASDPATVAARQIYSFVRHANSGSANYDAPDLFMYLLAMGELYSLLGWMLRIYGVMQHFNGMNRSIPKDLIRAMGADYDDFILHLADFRLFINLCIHKINSFYVPVDFPYFLRKLFIFGKVFKDTPEDKADIFLFQPHSFLKFDGTSDPNGSCLVLTQCSDYNNPSSFAVLTSFVNQFIDALLGEEDINIMSGDILKAYGDRVFKLSEITEDYCVVPEYSGEILAQFHNATIVNMEYIDGTDNFEVHQDATGAIIQGRAVIQDGTPLTNGVSNAAYSVPQYLDADDDTSPAYNMIATRLKCAGSVSYNGDNSQEKFTITECGTEVVVGYHVLAKQVNGTTNYSAVHFGLRNVGNWVGYIWDASALTSYMHLKPLIHMYDTGSSSTVNVVGEINNFTTIDGYEQFKLNTVALMSLFNVSMNAVTLKQGR